MQNRRLIDVFSVVFFLLWFAYGIYEAASWLGKTTVACNQITFESLYNRPYIPMLNQTFSYATTKYLTCNFLCTVSSHNATFQRKHALLVPLGGTNGSGRRKVEMRACPPSHQSKILSEFFNTYATKHGKIKLYYRKECLKRSVSAT